ncbi:MAG: hypothetical protein ACRC0V_02990, partial [Fusobacteriaceae bacterium]
TLLVALSTAALGASTDDTNQHETQVSADSDPMGMMSAFMGSSESDEIGGGETSVPSASATVAIVPVSSVITTVTNSNITTSTPYSYK